MLMAQFAIAQPWIQNNSIFNPSGVPSLPFSQPRFADLDGDGDLDMIIGSIEENPVFIENTGTADQPEFVPGEDIFAPVEALDAEMAICTDIDDDGDADLVTGGYTGLNLYENTGTSTDPEFEKIEDFFAGLAVGQIPVPDLADIDNDGDADMVVGMSESGIVKIYINTGTPSAAAFSEAESYEIGDVGLYAYPQFADMDADEDLDLLVGRDGQGFIFYRNTGDPSAAVWEADPEPFDGLGQGTYWNSPGLADLDADGTYDLVYGTASGPLQYFVNSGTPEIPSWQENTSLFGGVLDAGGASNPFFCDYDGDGDLDMFSGSWLGDVLYFENTGTPTGPAWQENSAPFESLKHSIYSAVTVGDVNADGHPDAIVGDLSGGLFYHRNTGDGFVYEAELLQDINLGGWACPRLVDFDGDEDYDIVAGNEDGDVAYIENQGSASMPEWVEIPGFFNGVGVNHSCAPAVCDVDLDGDFDILCGNLSGELHYFEQDGGMWLPNSEMFQGISVDQNATPAFADLDSDGDPDLTIGEYNGPFNYYSNQLMVAGIEPVSSVDAQATIRPNPITSASQICFNLEAGADVSIQIFDARGRLVRENEAGYLSAGTHSLTLNAETLPSGWYLFRLNLSGEFITLKGIRR